jgi:hypothetical protein
MSKKRKRLKRKPATGAVVNPGTLRKARKKPWELVTLDELASDPHCREDVWVPTRFFSSLEPTGAEEHPAALDGNVDCVEMVSKVLGIPNSSIDPKAAASICDAIESLNEFGIAASRAGTKLVNDVVKAMHAAVNQLGNVAMKMEAQRREREDDDDDDDGIMSFDSEDELMDFFKESKRG